MTVYYVDDGGNGSDGSSWPNAYTSLSALDDAVTLASDDIVYIGHDHVCQYVHGTNRTITGPTSGRPCVIISATQGSAPPTYQKSSSNQIDVTEGVYALIFDGAFELHGVRLACGSYFQFAVDGNEIGSLNNCTVAPGVNAMCYFGSSAHIRIENLTIDLTADGSTDRANDVFRGGSTGTKLEILGLSFVNAAYRNGEIIGSDSNNGEVVVSGADFSGFTNGTACEIVSQAGLNCPIVINNSLTAATWTPIAGFGSAQGTLCITNTGPASAPTYLYYQNYFGAVVSSAIYRTGGATIESAAVSWLVTTNSTATEGSQFNSPWIYGLVASTGSKTFDVYITNDTADFTNAEVWLEVEYLGTSSEAIFSLADNHRATILTTAANQTDDTASTWNGAGPSFTYKQKLSVTATVNVAGLYRARVCAAKASIASSAYFYIDPKVTVS